MLTGTSLNQCIDCDVIDDIIDKIDCILTEQNKECINNDKYYLNKKIPHSRIEKLIKYKLILTKRRFNSQYIWKIPNSDIISRVKTLLIN